MKINPHQAVVIQGPMDYDPIKVGDFYKQFDNLVWSTWNDTPEHLVTQIRQMGIEVILNEKPTFTGNHNVNLQFVSTLCGIEHFKDTNPNITEIIKIRSDMLVFGMERLLNRVNGSDMSFAYLYDKNKSTHRPIYYLDYWHAGMDFPADFVVHGSMDAMYNTFNFQMEYFSDIPPEAIILRNYLRYRGFENNFNLGYLDSIGIKFFAQHANVDDYYGWSTKFNKDLFRQTL
jgi:hypothetical protein